MRLASGPAALIVDLESGGRISSLTIDSREVLVTTGWGPFAWGSFPMVPWAGRVRDGAFSFRGRRHALPLNDPPVAIHGLLAERAWSPAPGDGPNAIACDLAPPWPFGGRVVQSFDLADDHLTVEMALEAAEPQPAVIGWHPWFRRRLGPTTGPRTAPDPGAEQGGAVVEIEPARMYHRGPDRLPTGELVAPGEHPWDDCVIDLARPPVVRWPGALAIEISSTASHWVVYEESPGGVCVEPQTGPPDGLTVEPRVVEAGEPLRLAMTWRWQPDVE